jgi:O-antigen/teichoic acid export membrane protein
VKKVYAFTLACEVLIAASMMLAFRLAADNWGSEGFAEYSLVRRIIAFAIPVTLIGLDVGIPRFVARFGANSAVSSAAVLNAGVRLSIISGATILIAFNGLTESASIVFMGSAQYAGLIGPLSLLLFAITLHTCSYAYLRGRMKFYSATIIQVIAYVVIPLGCFWLIRESLALALWWTASLLLGFSVVSLIACGIRIRELALADWQLAGTLFRYSARRVPAAMALLGIASLPVFLVVHTDGSLFAGYVSFSMLSVNAVSSVLSPLGLVLLPKASRAFALGDEMGLKSSTRVATLVLFAVGSIATIVVFVGAEFVSTLFFGAVEPTIARLLRVTSVAILPAAYYMCLRTVIDAKFDRAVNSQNVVYSLGFVLALLGVTFLAGDAITGFAVYACTAYVLAFLLLASLTRRSLITAFDGRLSEA